MAMENPHLLVEGKSNHSPIFGGYRLQYPSNDKNRVNRAMVFGIGLATLLIFSKLNFTLKPRIEK